MTIQPLSNIIDVLNESIIDPVYGDELTEAMTLFPCGHHVNQDVLEECMRKGKVCPVDHQAIESSAANHTIRKIVKTIHDLRKKQHLEEGEIRSTIPILDKHEVNLNTPPTLAAKKASLLHSIQLNPTDTNAYFTLIPLLKDEEIVRLNGVDSTLKDIYQKMLENNPDCKEVYAFLAKKLKTNESIFYHKSYLSQKDCCIEAIKRGVDDLELYAILIDLMQNTEIDSYLKEHRKEICIKAIQFNPQLNKAYIYLAKNIQNNEKITLFKKEYTRIDLYIKGAELGFYDPSLYIYLASEILLNNSISIKGKTYNRIELFKEIIIRTPEYANAYFYLGFFIGDEAIDLQGKQVTKKDLLTMTIEKNPVHMQAWLALWEVIKNNEVILIGEDLIGKKESGIKFIELFHGNTTVSASIRALYDDCAYLLKKNEYIQTRQGKIQKKDLYCKNIEYNPYKSRFYQSLIDLLDNTETIEICYYGKKTVFNHGELKRAMQLAQKIEQHLSQIEQRRLEIQNVDSSALQKIAKQQASEILQLAAYIQNGYPCYLDNYQYVDKKSLYTYCVHLDENNYLYYIHLAALLKKHETVQLKQNLIFSRENLLERALRLSQNNVQAYCQIARVMEPKERITLYQPIGPFIFLSRKELYFQAINLDPMQADLYAYLADEMDTEETYLIKEKLYMKKQLYILSIELKPDKTNPYFSLTKLLATQDETIMIEKMPYNKYALFENAVSHHHSHTYEDPDLKQSICYEAAYFLQNEHRGSKKTVAHLSIEDLYYQVLHYNWRHKKACIGLLAMKKPLENVTLDNGIIIDSRYLESVIKASD